MLCSMCHGKHLVYCHGRLQPCEECGGFGIVNWGEGDQAQPDPEVPAPDSIVDVGRCESRPPLHWKGSRQGWSQSFLTSTSGLS
jgi:hypothetical protein